VRGLAGGRVRHRAPVGGRRRGAAPGRDPRRRRPPGPQGHSGGGDRGPRPSGPPRDHLLLRRRRSAHATADRQFHRRHAHGPERRGRPARHDGPARRHERRRRSGARARAGPGRGSAAGRRLVGRAASGRRGALHPGAARRPSRCDALGRMAGGGVRSPAGGGARGPARAAEHRWTLLEIARTAFFERFQACMGQTPAEYLQWWRLQRAAQRLRETQDSVVQIALAVGYDNPSAFARVFRKALGESPTEFRASPVRAWATAPAKPGG
jgi:hypothetical protein